MTTSWIFMTCPRCSFCLGFALKLKHFILPINILRMIIYIIIYIYKFGSKANSSNSVFPAGCGSCCRCERVCGLAPQNWWTNLGISKARQAHQARHVLVSCTILTALTALCISARALEALVTAGLTTALVLGKRRVARWDSTRLKKPS